MRIGLTISTVLHALVLFWALFNFAPRALEAAPRDSLPVDIISSTEFSQMTSGNPEAPKAPVPKPLVEKVGDRKPSENHAPKVVEKLEIVATASTPPPPEAKPEAKKEPEKKQSEPQRDLIAEALVEGLRPDDDAVWVYAGPDRQALVLARGEAQGKLLLRYLPIANLRQDKAGKIQFEPAEWKPGLPQPNRATAARTSPTPSLPC